MNMNINGYKIVGKGFTCANAGCSRWAFAQREDHDFFIKEFTEIKYPDPKAVSKAILNKKIKRCQDFYNKKKKLYQALAECRTGNVMAVVDFFLFGNSYYAVTDRIKGDPLDVSEICNLSDKIKLFLCRSLLYSLSVLHLKGIVHSDIKPENILVIHTIDGGYAAKIIDFDMGFLLGQVPSHEDIGGDQVYWSPEALKWSKKETVDISSKIDVFSLGILFHEYWTGVRPFVPGDYTFLCEALAEGKKVRVDSSIPACVKTILRAMLHPCPAKRLSSFDAFELFSELSFGSKKVEEIKEKIELFRQGTKIPLDMHEENKECSKSFQDSSTITKLKIRMKPTTSISKVDCKSEDSISKYKGDSAPFFRPDDFD